MENLPGSRYRQPSDRQATTDALSDSGHGSVEGEPGKSNNIPVNVESIGSATTANPEGQEGENSGQADWSEATIISQRPTSESQVPANTKRSSTPGMTPVMAAAQVLLGKSLDHFQLLELIGGGGMGAVFRARDSRLDRIVAVKVIPAAGQDAETAKRFKVEAQSAARLDHPNIARVYYVGEVDEWSYIVFEYVDGINLRDLVVSKGPLSIDEAVWFVRQVAEALTHASARLVVHRDIKPSNVLVTKRGLVKLVDMGLARTVAMEKNANDLTASNITLGTFDYISPEQARDPRSADVRSDLYSLGCTLYFLLSGKPPFPDGTAIQKLMMHGNAKATDIRRLRIDITDELAAIVNKLMEKNPSQRYQQPIELINDLYLLAEFESLPKSRQAGTVSITPTIEGKTVFESLLPWMVTVGLLCGVILWMQNMHRVSSMIRLPKEKVAFTVASSNNQTAEAIESTGGRLTEQGNTANNGTATSSDLQSLPNGLDLNSWIAMARRSMIESSEKAFRAEPRGKTAPNQNKGIAASGSEANSTLLPQSPESPAQGAPPTQSRLTLDWLSKLATQPLTSVSPLVTRPIDQQLDHVLPKQTNEEKMQKEFRSRESIDPETSIVVDPSGTFQDDGLWKVSRSLQDALLIASADPRRSQILLMGNVRILDELTWNHPSILIRGLGEQRARIEIALRSESMPTFNSDPDDASSGFNLNSQSLRLSGVDIDLYSPESSSGITTCFQVHSGAIVELTDCRITMMPSISGWRASVFTTRTAPENRGPVKETDDTIGNGIEPMPLASVRTKEQSLDPIRLVLENCFVRGTGDFLLQRQGQMSEVRWTNGLLAIDGRVLEYTGMSFPSRIPWNIRMQWDHVTALAKRGFSRLRYNAQTEHPICLSCSMEGCAFITDIDAAFMEFEGVDELNLLKATIQDQAMWTQWLDYRGLDNAYDSDVQEMIRLRSNGKIVTRFDFATAIRNILFERSAEPSIRWINRPNLLMAPSRLEVDDFLIRPSTFNPGMNSAGIPKSVLSDQR